MRPAGPSTVTDVPPDARATPPARRLSAATLSAYSLGSVAYGVKDAGFGTFLLLYYNQVLGVPAATVGLVIMAALLLDALVDPAVGFLSDRTRGRWGRRHPWMYASALPIALGWVAVWSPPAMGQSATLAWLFGWAVLVRSAVSCLEVPSVALTPELTSDYDERTRIMAHRYLYGWAGGLTALLSAYLFFLAPVPAVASRAAYAGFGVASAVLIAGSILLSALGTHREIPNLPQPAIVRGRLRDSFGELAETVRNRGFAMLMLAGLCAFVLQGLGYALSNYFYAFVWRIGGTTLLYLTIALLLGAIAAFLLAPRVARRGSKARWAIVFVLAAGVVNTGPYWLRLAGWFPTPDDAAMVPTYFVFVILGTMTSVSGFILGGSMMADVVEDSEAKTGRRSEGVFFAGYFFVQKCSSGLGIFLAGTMLTVSGFPAAATPTTVDPATVDRLTLLFASSYVVLTGTAAVFFARFPFGRVEHEARLAGEKRAG